MLKTRYDKLKMRLKKFLGHEGYTFLLPRLITSTAKTTATKTRIGTRNNVMSKDAGGDVDVLVEDVEVVVYDGEVYGVVVVVDVFDGDVVGVVEGGEVVVDVVEDGIIW